ncbi:MAG: hypothetical protein ABF619_05545 [Oenococcus oeni]
MNDNKLNSRKGRKGEMKKSSKFFTSILVAVSLSAVITPLSVFADTASTTTAPSSNDVTIKPSVIKSGFYTEGTHLFVDGTYIGEVPTTVLSTRSASVLSVNAKAASAWTKGKTFHTTLKTYTKEQAAKTLWSGIAATLIAASTGPIGSGGGIAMDLYGYFRDYYGKVYPNHKTPKGKYVAYYYSYKIIGSGEVEYEIHYNFYRNSNYTNLQLSLVEGPIYADLN